MTKNTGVFRYEIRVERHIGTAAAAHFPEFALTHNADGSSTLCGDLSDQAALHGVLARIRDLGLILTEVKRHQPASRHVQR